MDESIATPQWRRSTRCGSSACVEVAMERGSVLVRDSKDPHGPVLTFTPAEWAAFTEGVTAGEFKLE
jgi:hypothetical protein